MISFNRNVSCCEKFWRGEHVIEKNFFLPVFPPVSSDVSAETAWGECCIPTSADFLPRLYILVSSMIKTTPGLPRRSEIDVGSQIITHQISIPNSLFERRRNRSRGTRESGSRKLAWKASPISSGYGWYCQRPSSLSSSPANNPDRDP